MSEFFLKHITYSFIHKRLKKFTRSGINNQIINSSKFILPSHRILIVGGYGPISDLIKEVFEDNYIRELDINSEHHPDYLIDIQDTKAMSQIQEKYDAIFVLEVLEHLLMPQKGLENLQKLLTPDGIIIGSTPWIIPIHDRPFDFYRFTHYSLSNMIQSSKLEVVEIYCRGNYVDSVICLMFRGLKVHGIVAKVMSVLALIISLLRLSKPKTYDTSQDACIGYSWIGKNNQKL